MSVAAMASCWGSKFPSKAELPVSQSTVLAVALAIADSVSDQNHNEYYGSVIRLAEKVNLSRETVGLAVQHLVNVGVLKLLQQRPGRTSRYQWGYLTDTSVRSPDGTFRQGVTDVSVTNPREPKMRTQEQYRRAAGKDESMNFGADPERVDTPVPKRAKERPFGGDSDSQPKEVRTPAKSTQVMNHMELLWPQVATAQGYHNCKVTDRKAFASYLNHTFLGPDAKTPLDVETLKAVVSHFMQDLEIGRFRLKDGQPVWMAFTRRWQKYSSERVTPANDRLRELQAQEFKVDRSQAVG